MIMYEKKKQRKRGGGLINKIINKHPFEMHMPRYSYCGPGTKLEARLARGDPLINEFDSACREHDIAYSKNKNDMSARHAADKVLAEKTCERVKAKDAKFSEKAAAYAVTNAMKLKRKLGTGLKTKSKNKISKKKPETKTTLKSIIQRSSKVVNPYKTPKSMITTALKASRLAVKEAGGKSKVQVPRILPVASKIRGFLPLVPLFAGLSTTGALAGSAASIYKAINDAKSAKRKFEESHNKTMKTIALGKGLYLRSHKRGLGLYLKSFKSNDLKKKVARS